jgi:hypothetical protein
MRETGGVGIARATAATGVARLAWASFAVTALGIDHPGARRRHLPVTERGPRRDVLVLAAGELAPTPPLLRLPAPRSLQPDVEPRLEPDGRFAAPTLVAADVTDAFAPVAPLNSCAVRRHGKLQGNFQCC